MKSNIVTVSRKHQATTPVDIRKRLDIRPGSKMVMLAMNGHITLLPLPEAYCGTARGLNSPALPGRSGSV